MNQSIIKICIDAGHGGKSPGATRNYDEKEIKEKDLNLEISLKLEEELSKYNNIEIIQTRNSDIAIDIDRRVEIAKENACDFLISIHNNATAQLYQTECSGCMVLPPGSRYQPVNSKVSSIYDACDRLSHIIINHLNKIGIPTSMRDGLYRREYSPNGGASSTKYYPNGEIMDYYGIVRIGVELGIPAIIIEHAFLNNENDYRNFLSDQEKLHKLAIADADAIAEYFSLTLKSNI